MGQGGNNLHNKGKGAFRVGHIVGKRDAYDEKDKGSYKGKLYRQPEGTKVHHLSPGSKKPYFTKTFLASLEATNS